MKHFAVLLCVCLLTCLLCACQKVAQTDTTTEELQAPEQASEPSVTEQPLDQSAPEQVTDEAPPEQATESPAPEKTDNSSDTVQEMVGGGLDEYNTYRWFYGAVPQGLYEIAYERYGKETVDAISDEMIAENRERMANGDYYLDNPFYRFVSRFGITLEEALPHMDWIYTEEEAAILFADDTAAIKKAFVNTDLALYSEQTQEVYGIREISGMTAEELAETGLSLDDVQALYEKNKNSRFLTDAQKTALQNLLQA